MCVCVCGVCALCSYVVYCVSLNIQNSSCRVHVNVYVRANVVIVCLIDKATLVHTCSSQL